MSDLPSHIGRYAVERRLGEGGMGEVFLAFSPAGSPVAVKLIRKDKLDPVARARFEREAEIARTVIGTNRVARFLDADPNADRPWLAMEYVPGYTIREYVHEHGVLPAPLVASLGALAAEGLEAVHNAGLLHRDLKPHNVILGGDGPIIIDFGLAAFVEATSSHASISHEGLILGTVPCMPPEQASGNPKVTTAADVYALGTVLLYAATEHYPYSGPSVDTVLWQITNPGIAPNLDGVPARLLPLLRKMLAHDAGDRPTVAEVAVACAELLQAASVSPAEARLALISRTAGRHPSLRAGLVPTASLEARLDALADEVDEDQDGPLDVPPSSSEAEEPEPATAEPEKATSGTQPGGRAPRRPPSSRIAEDLRGRYAARSSL